MPSGFLKCLQLPQFGLLMILLGTARAHAAPPVLSMASAPLTTACRPSDPPVNGRLDGASLVRAATRPGQESTLYQAAMRMTDWGGHFTRYSIAPGAAGLAQAPLAAWEAGAILTGDATHPPFPAPAKRHIYTASVRPDGTFGMTPFAWDSLSATQREQLDRAPDGAADGLGAQRLAWLRGDRSREGQPFRARSSVLGNSVNSTPVYVGPPAAAHAPARPDVIYLGANDGMLHAFDASDGKELFAYVPAALFGALSQLTSPQYVHRAYVDGPASAGDVTLAGDTRTVLLSALGGGAQGVFALDITDPLHFAEHGVLWEFTDRDDAMLGNVTSLPQLARLQVATRGGVPVYRDFAVVASGANNYAADGFASPTGAGALFLLALDKPRAAPWRLDDNYYRLVTPIADAAQANALHAPVLLRNREGALRYAYAGDLQGNVWRVDFQGGPPWATAVGPGKDSTPLYVARDAAGRRQPIAQQPQLAFADAGGYLVLFGTGKLIEPSDRTRSGFAPQTYYAIRDTLRSPPELVTSRSRLTRRVVTGDPASARFALDGEPMEPDSMGWYIDLLQSSSTGERSLDSGVLLRGVLAFNTLVPAQNACDAPGSRTYVVNALTGLPDALSVTARLPAPAMVPAVIGELTAPYAARPMLVPVATRTRPRDPAGGTRIEHDVAMANPDPRGAVLTGTVHTSARAGRLSWREIANWRQLHGETP